MISVFRSDTAATVNYRWTGVVTVVVTAGVTIVATGEVTGEWLTSNCRSDRRDDCRGSCRVAIYDRLREKIESIENKEISQPENFRNALKPVFSPLQRLLRQGRYIAAPMCFFAQKRLF